MKKYRITLFLCCIATSLLAGTTYDAWYAGVPFETRKAVRPAFPDRTVSVADYGAMGDGLTDNTGSINQAIRELSAQGGGRVVVPSGIWKTGPIELLDNINLHAGANALIIFDPDPKQYPIVETSFEGLNTRRCTSPIHARGAKNIAITGSGVFDGSGDAWRFVKRDKMTESQWRALTSAGGVLDAKGDTWYPSEESMRGHQVSDAFNVPHSLTTDAEWEAIRHWLRPVMVSLAECTNVWLEGVTFRNSPAWCLHPLSCENVIIENLKVFNPWYSQNGDGLDLESCTNALIINNLFDVGDDAICLKSGKDKDGRERGEPCRNVVIRNNTVLHGHGGFVVGSEMSGGVENIYVADCLFLGTDVGLRFKSTRGRGGVVQNIWIENINMINIPTEPLLFDLHYSGRSALEDLAAGKKAADDALPAVTEETPSFRNIHIKNVKCDGARRAMYFNGLPEMKIKDIFVEDMIVSATYGAELVETDNVILNNVRIFPEKGATFTFRNTTNLSIDGNVIETKENEALTITN